MTTRSQTTTHEKARDANTGNGNILQGYQPATLEQLVGDTFLIKLYEILEPKRLLSVTDNTTVYHGDEIGKTELTASTIALAITDKQGDIVGAVFYTPNSKVKPLVIDPTGYGAIVIGDINKASEVIAFNDLDSGIGVYMHLMASDKTIIVSPQKTKQCLKKMVQHWSNGSQVTVPMTLDDKGLINLLAGVKAQALVTVAHIVTMLQHDSYEAILTANDTQLVNLQESAYYPEWRDDPQLNEPMVCGDGRFELYHDGLFFVKYILDDPTHIRYKFDAFVCSPLEVIAKTRDTSSGTWGRLLQWCDDDNVKLSGQCRYHYCKVTPENTAKSLSVKA